MYRKNDEYDAYCVATVLINQLHTLPDAKSKDNEWILAQLVNRRDLLVKDGIRLKMDFMSRFPWHIPVTVNFQRNRREMCHVFLENQQQYFLIQYNLNNLVR